MNKTYCDMCGQETSERCHNNGIRHDNIYVVFNCDLCTACAEKEIAGIESLLKSIENASKYMSSFRYDFKKKRFKKIDTNQTFQLLDNDLIDMPF